MAKGNEAKEKVIEKIKESFGNDFVGVYDKKVYLWSEENGERVQVSLSLTCPKNPIGQIENFTHGNKIEFEEPIGTPEPPQISQEEENTIAELMAKLGL